MKRQKPKYSGKKPKYDKPPKKSKTLIIRLKQRESRKEGLKEIQKIHYNKIKRGLIIKKSDDPHTTDFRIFREGKKVGFSNTYMLNMMKGKHTYKENEGAYKKDKTKYIKKFQK